MSFVKCNFEDHGDAILEIFNEVIENSTTLYESELRTLTTLEAWFKNKEQQGFPVYGYVDSDQNLLGFITYGRFRLQPATKLSIEHSFYVAKSARGQKVGSKLLKKFLKHAKEQGFTTTIAAIDSENKASIKLHKKFDFKYRGKIKKIAKKFDRWLDLEFYQLILNDSGED